MKNYVVRLSVLAGAVLLPTVSSAQERAPVVVRLTPYVGYIAFGSFANGPLGTRLTSQGSALYGVQLGLDLAPNVALVGNLGYATSSLEVGAPLIGGVRLADANALLYDGGIQLRFPAMGAAASVVVPFVEGGAGAIRYDVRRGPLVATSTNFAANFGGGLDLQLGRAVGLRLMAKDYVGRFDFREAAGLDLTGNLAHNMVYGVGVNLGF